MDRKSITIIVAAVALLLVGSRVIDHFYPPAPVTEPPPGMETNQPGSATPSGLPAKPGASPKPVLPPAAVQSSEPEQTLLVTNDDLVFRFTSLGGLKEVFLRKYPAIISRTGETSLKTNMAALNLNAPEPILAVEGPAWPAGNNFVLTQNGRTVTASRTLADGLRVVKEFDIGTNYLFTARMRLENVSDKPINLPACEVVVGTATPTGPLDDASLLGTYWYNGIKGDDKQPSWFANHMGGCAMLPSTPRYEYEDGASNVVWAAVHNQFFTLAAIPSNPAPRILVRLIEIPPPAVPPELTTLTNASSAMLTNGYQTAFGYPAAVLPPHKALDRTYTFYAGPKDYFRLSQIGERMGNKLDYIMGFSGVFGFFSELLLLSMNGLMKVLAPLGLGYGWAIITITIILKAVFWPLTRASTRSQKRMQALQPQMKAIADKYKDDPTKKNQKTMEFMKEHKLNPLGSCLPVAIQIPIFFGFYYMLRNAIELRGVHFLWAHDLSQPDTVGYLPILGGIPINPLPLLMGATQLWQQFLLPPSPGMEPGQQKMMRYMPLMFIAIFYRMSAGLNLYYTVSNLLGILQTKITKTTDAAKPGQPAPVAAKKKK